MGKIWVGLEDPEKAPYAYQWHRGFASSNPHLYSQGREEFEALANSFRVIAAKDDAENYIGLAYFDLKKPDWIIGGLMTASAYRNRGIGLVITCLTLCHVIIFENPLARKERVVAYVATTNSKPLFLAERLALRSTGAMASNAEGAQFNEYEITVPETVKALAQWCADWSGSLLDGTPVTIESHLGLSLKDSEGDLLRLLNSCTP